ncbi:septum formation family protein [Actinokineospora inagensis]|uniref:septum formation family protein n=1 Tax=Actinokineospora inagensis TaxID=103730 RepID=UPI001FE01262|nr:septum formation family protein [Actinokineospora inagensis]
MSGAFAGSLLLLISSMAFSWPVGAGGGLSAEEERARAFDSPAGSCLNWTPPDPTDMRRVDCAQPHLFEVTSNVDISADYPASAPPPDLDHWQDIAQAKCTPSATSYLGGKLDPYGKFRVNALKPVDSQWQNGDRKLRCGLQRIAPSGGLLPSTGSAATQDQSDVHDPGTCLELNGQKIGDPISCDKAHAYEIVGSVDLSQAFTGDFPADDAQREKAIELCAAVTKEYTGGADLTAKHLTPYSDTLKQESWAAGSRKVDCKVGAKLPDGSGLAPITNSVRAIGSTATASASATPTPTPSG